MLMVRELSDEEIQEVWDKLDVTERLKRYPFWEWNNVIRLDFAKALFEAARVEQTCDRDQEKK